MKFQVTFQGMTLSDLFVVDCEVAILLCWNDKVGTKLPVSANMTIERICRWSGFQQLKV